MQITCNQPSATALIAVQSLFPASLCWRFVSRRIVHRSYYNYLQSVYCSISGQSMPPSLLLLMRDSISCKRVGLLAYRLRQYDCMSLDGSIADAMQSVTDVPRVIYVTSPPVTRVPVRTACFSSIDLISCLSHQLTGWTGSMDPLREAQALNHWKHFVTQTVAALLWHKSDTEISRQHFCQHYMLLNARWNSHITRPCMSRHGAVPSLVLLFLIFSWQNELVRKLPLLLLLLFYSLFSISKTPTMLNVVINFHLTVIMNYTNVRCKKTPAESKCCYAVKQMSVKSLTYARGIL